MCFGGGSKSSTPAPPAPNPPTTFDYSAGQRNADGAVSQAQTARQLSSTVGPGSFGSELGGNSTPTTR